MPLIVAGTDSITLPVGTTAQRNATPVTGMYRLNSTTGTTEVYNGTNWVTESPVAGTAVTLTTQTSVDFTSIPSGVKRITVMFNGVSTSGTSNKLIQLGTGSTTYTTTGYTSTGVNISSTAPTTNTFTTGFGINSGLATETLTGSFVLVNQTGNTWVITGNCSSGTVTWWTSGSIALAAALTAVRTTTVNGTDTFDAGSINILYE
jgi:hypothetical protein